MSQALECDNVQAQQKRSMSILKTADNICCPTKEEKKNAAGESAPSSRSSVLREHLALLAGFRGLGLHIGMLSRKRSTQVPTTKAIKINTAGNQRNESNPTLSPQRMPHHTIKTPTSCSNCCFPNQGYDMSFSTWLWYLWCSL